eukprot:Hpha_TRINITY_DN15657_c0_g1::TRINITY_DN15657_c0_g1_i4::g.97738::m.97738
MSKRKAGEVGDAKRRRVGCPYCDYDRFESPQELIAHLEEAHGGTKGGCEGCPSSCGDKRMNPIVWDNHMSEEEGDEWEEVEEGEEGEEGEEDGEWEEVEEGEEDMDWEECEEDEDGVSIDLGLQNLVWPPKIAAHPKAFSPTDLLVHEVHTMRRAGENSFWVPAKAGGAESKVPKNGVEVWVQRRGPEMSKQERGINWHFDKDEELREEYDTVLNPFVATVNYITQVGSPTFVLDINPKTDGIKSGQTVEDSRAVLSRPDLGFWASYPEVGKHIAFAGNMLHGVCAELEVGEEGERVTLLVNVWVGHTPLGLKALSSVLPPAKKNTPKVVFSPAEEGEWQEVEGGDGKVLDVNLPHTGQKATLGVPNEIMKLAKGGERLLFGSGRFTVGGKKGGKPADAPKKKKGGKKRK